MKYDLGLIAFNAGVRSDVQIKTAKPTREIERELERAMRPVINYWAENMPAPLRMNDNMPDIENTHLGATAAVTASIASLWEWLDRLDRHERGKWVAAVQTALGVDISAMAPMVHKSADLAASVEWATNLIKDLNDDMRKRVKTAMLDASVRRLSVDETAVLLRKQVSIVRKRARLIAYDQTHKIAAKMNEIQQVSAGIDEYVWQHSFKKNPRRHHVARQGLRFKWSKPPKDGHPSHAINCRCRAVALLRARTRREAYLK